MSVNCYDLLSLKCFKDIKLIAGKNGVYRQVTWPYICISSSISQWVYGGELVFIKETVFELNEDNLIKLIEECKPKTLAGIVLISCSDQYIEVSDKFIQYGDENNFPIFVMNRKTKLIDVTQEISGVILYHREQFRQSQLFLDKLLFSDCDSAIMNEMYTLFDLSNKPYRFILIFNIEPLHDTGNQLHLSYIINDLIYDLNHQCNSNSKSLIASVSSNNTICMASADKFQTIDSLKDTIIKIFHKIRKQYEEAVNINLGFGRVYNDEEKSGIRLSFNEAQRCISLLKKGLFKGNILYYEDIGIYKIFYEVENTYELISYYNKNIGQLIENDKKNNSHLVETLRIYLKNNCNLANTAKDLFIHRNTLIYRLNIISDILKKDLYDSTVRFELYMSLLAYDFIRN